jgi:outer membrane protein
MNIRLLWGLLLVWAISIPAVAQKALTLDDCRKLALQNNAKVKNSALEVEAARQTRKAALTSYFPKISAGGTMFRAEEDLFETTTQGGNLPVYDGNPANIVTATQFAYLPGATVGMLKSGTIGVLTAVQPVFAGGRIINGNKLASLGEDVSELKSRLSQNEVLLKTEEQYWLVVSLHDKLRTVNRYEDLLIALLRQVEDAYRSGLVMKNDVLKVNLKRSEVRLNKSKVLNGIVLATMALCQHIGIPYDSTLVLGDSLTIIDHPESYHVDHAIAVQTRAEYGLLQASVRAEELQSNMKLGEYLPQVGVGVSGLYMKLDEHQDKTVGLVFGTVSIPISDWWEASHTLSERSVKEKIAENALKESSELLLLQMQKAWQEVTDGYTQVRLGDEAAAQAQENLSVNHDGYKNGLTSLSDLLEAQAALQQANDRITDARASYRLKILAYLQATGR